MVKPQEPAAELMVMQQAASTVLPSKLHQSNIF
jgi:hypothetical protein